jgi:hypothetical protein
VVRGCRGRQGFVRLACDNELVLGQRTVPLLCLILGIGVVASACTSPKVQEAAESLGGPVDAPVECATTADNQSGGLYRRSGGPGTLLVRVLWDQRSATTFTSAHSGRAQFLGRAASPHYEKVVVAGLPAYWQLRPMPGPGGVHGLSSMKSGYAVLLTSMDLNQFQVENALAVILNQL